MSKLVSQIHCLISLRALSDFFREKRPCKSNTEVSPMRCVSLRCTKLLIVLVTCHGSFWSDLQILLNPAFKKQTRCSPY